MSSHPPVTSVNKTPRTRAQKSRFQYKVHSPLKQHRSILQPSNTTPNKALSTPFTFSVAPKALNLTGMPPRTTNTSNKGGVKGKTKQTQLNFAKAKATLPLEPTLMPAVLSTAPRTTKRALSPASIHNRDDGKSKKFKSDAVGTGLANDVETASSNGSLPPSSADQSLSNASAHSEPMTVSADEKTEHESPPSEPPRYSLIFGNNGTTRAQTPPHTPPRSGTSQTPATAARMEISKTPKAPWLIPGSKIPKATMSPVKKSVKPVGLSTSKPTGLKFPTNGGDLFPPTEPSSSAPIAGNNPFDAEILDAAPSASQEPAPVEHIPIKAKASTSKTTSTSHHHLNIRNVPKARPNNANVSAAFALPVSLSPTKTPAKPFISSKAKPIQLSQLSPKPPSKASKPSILQRVGTSGALFNAEASSSKSPLSSTLAALMNRTTIDPHAATQAQLSTLSQALEELDAPRPTSAMSQRPPMSRPSTSLGHSEATRKPVKGLPGRQTVLNKMGIPKAPNVIRPGTSIGMVPVSKSGKLAAAMQGGGKTIAIGNGRPSVAPIQPTNTSAEARRASSASLALSQSVPMSLATKGGKQTGNKPTVPVYTQSGRRVVSAAARAAPLPSSQANSSADNISVSGAEDGNIPVAPDAETPLTLVSNVPLTVLKDCVIFVDVRTEDGEDAGSLFVDMLRGLGAKILTRMGNSLTHIVYKSGLPSTLTRFRTLPEPKPAVVGIGWAVECVEKKEKAEVTKYLINLEEEAGSVLEGLKVGKATGTKKEKEGKATQSRLNFKPVPKAS